MTQEQRRKLVSEILTTDAFRGKSRRDQPEEKKLGTLLIFLSENAVDGAIPMETIEQAPCFDGLNLKDRREAKEEVATARVLLTRLRKALDTYFTDLHYENKVRLALPNAVGGMYRLVVCKNDSVYPQSEAVNRLWLPFLKPREVVRILVDPMNSFADSQPKRVQSWRDRGPKDVYFPLGVLEAISAVSGFLRSRDVGWQVDYQERVPTPDTSTIIIGDSLFKDLQPTDIQFPTLLNEQKGMWFEKTESSQDTKARLADAEAEGSKDIFISHEEDTIEGQRWVPVGSLADHFRNIKGARFFRCFARVTRVPVSWQHGLTAWRFSAFHSIAVEAALKFLLTPADVAELWGRMKSPSKVYEGDDAVNFQRRDLVPTLEELGILLQVTCSLTDTDSLDLRPGIPRNFLKIEDTKLIKVIQPHLPNWFDHFYDPATTKDE